MNEDMPQAVRSTFKTKYPNAATYTKKLMVMQCENHEKLTQWGVIPLLVIDVWEHAYYLKYKNKRGDFVDALFNILNLDNVAQRFDLALKTR